VIRDTLQPKEVKTMSLSSASSATTELAQLHELIGGLRRCVSSLSSRYGDSPAMRRIVNDAERIMNDIDRLDIDAEELELARGVSHHHHVGEKIGIPDTQYASDFWQDVDDEGLGGTR
jgi:nitrogen-specific signal transduction histidine kinase